MAVIRFFAALFLAVVPGWGQDQWALVWSDEFNGPANSSPSVLNWNYDLGGGGWNHRELQTYTSSTQNSFLDGNGNLVIQAKQDPVLGFTSARLETQGKFQIAFGKIEARIKLPQGQGLWPAFWMLGTGFPTVPWPQSGEIDVAENIGSELSTIHGTLHGPGYSGAGGITAAFSLPGGAAYSGDFHIFGIIWAPGSVEFFVDGQSYQRITSSTLPAGAPWVFDAPFFILLNVAVGGDWPGNPNSTTIFPQSMTVDYVRVYRSNSVPVINPGGVVSGASFLPGVAPGEVVSVFGTGLAADTYNGLFNSALDGFLNSAGGTSVSVSGALAPLTYVSPTQINFQLPWSTPVGGSGVSVVANRGGTLTNIQTIAVLPTSPSVFALDGQAVLTCDADSSALGVNCTLWGTGFGAKTIGQLDGVPSSVPPYPITTSPCTLSIGGVFAAITYCGAAPGLIIDQLNFVYPAGIPAVTGGVPAVLTIGSQSGSFKIPLPGQ